MKIFKTIKKIKEIKEILKRKIDKIFNTKCKIYINTKIWYRKFNGNYLMHRDDDLPAMIFPTAQYWYKRGNHYRKGNLPARTIECHRFIIFTWYKEGQELYSLYIYTDKTIKTIKTIEKFVRIDRIINPFAINVKNFYKILKLQCLIKLLNLKYH